MKRNITDLARVVIAAAVLLGLVCTLAVSAYALTPSGAQITTSSIANYNNSAGTRMPATTSNSVTLTVGQVGGNQLSPTSGSATAPAGVAGYVAVAIKNTGNGSDAFRLTPAGDSSWSPKMIADTNGDGIHQSTETATVTTTPSVASGATYKCFLAATVPATAANQCSFSLSAASSFDSTKQAQGTYTIGAGAASQSSAYIRNWLLNGYYSNTTASTRLTSDYLGGEAATAPRAGQLQGGKTWTLKQSTTDTLDFLSIYGSTVQYCANYAAAYVYSPSAQSAQVWLGSNDGIKVWLNGTVIWTKDVTRGCTVDQDKAPAQLKTGWNRLLFKVAQNTSNWALVAKVCDSAGNALPGVTYGTDTGTSTGTAPVINGVTATSLTTNSAVISWTTNVATTGTVRYGKTTALGSSVQCATSSTQHSANLSGLSAGTTYYFVVDAKNAAGVTASSPSTTFRTASTTTAATYIRTWLLNGYYSNSTASTRLSNDYLGGEIWATPKAGQTQGGKTWTYKQTTTDTLDFLSVYGSTRTYCAAYACTYAYSPSEQDAQLWMGSSDGVKVWVNGVNVWTKDVGRTMAPDQDKAPVHLIAGWNRLLFKVSQNTGGWGLVAKVCDSAGKALPGVTTATDAGDTTPPTISNVKVDSTTGTRIVVTWQTSEPTTTRLDYGTTTAGTILAVPELSKDHAMVITGLTPNTNYVYKVVAVDVFGNWDYVDSLSQSTTTDQPAAFVSDWLTNGFYSYSDRTTRMSHDFLGGECSVAPTLQMTSGNYQWIHATGESNGYLDLGTVYGDPTEGVGYANVYVYSPAKQDGQLRLGSYGGIKAFFNGKAIWTNDVYRTWVADQDKVPVTLLQGWNLLILKVTQGGSGWGVSAKVSDSSGNALPGIQYEYGQ